MVVEMSFLQREVQYSAAPRCGTLDFLYLNVIMSFAVLYRAVPTLSISNISRFVIVFPFPSKDKKQRSIFQQPCLVESCRANAFCNPIPTAANLLRFPTIALFFFQWPLLRLRIPDEEPESHVPYFPFRFFPGMHTCGKHIE